MTDFLSPITTLQWLLLAVALMGAMFYWWTKANEAAWFDFLYNFPVRIWHIGRLKELKANTEQVAARQSWENGMPQPENSLCTEYKNKMGTANTPGTFNRAQEYLRLTYQSEISPMSFWAFALLVVLTISEAMGTGFLLSPFISEALSSNQIGYAGWVLAVTLAAILLKITHGAGKSAKKIMSIKHALGNLDKNGVPQDLVNNGKISASCDQSQDEGKSAEARFYRRAVNLKNRGSWVPSVVVGVLLVLVVTGVFGLRWYGIMKQNTIEVVQLTKNGVGEASAEGGNPFATAGVPAALPPDVTQSLQQSREKVAKEIGKADLMQGFGAAFLLALIYLLTQAAGFWFSYEHSFISEGAKAYALTKGEPDYQSYHAKYILPFEGRADSRLADLRRHFGSVLPEYARNPATKTFRQFVNEQQISTAAMHSVAHNEQGNQSTGSSISRVEKTASAQQLVATGANDVAMHDAVAASIMGLPVADRDAATLSWIKENGATKHTAGLKDAIARFKERKAEPQLDDELLNLLKD